MILSYKEFKAHRTFLGLGVGVSGELVSPDLCPGVDGDLRDRTQGESRGFV